MNTAVSAAPIRSDRSQNRFTSGPALVLYVAAAKLLLHLLTASRYGIFRDEMYYLACSQRMAWGYVDQPPGGVAMAWLARHLFGESLLGLRLLRLTIVVHVTALTIFAIAHVFAPRW